MQVFVTVTGKGNFNQIVNDKHDTHAVHLTSQ